jgi:SAM-dependent methyltransferase
MSDASAGQVSIEAAELYEKFFVPALFGQWPARLLALAGVAEGDRVLDVGCGSGVVARAARRAVGRSGAVTGVDPNDGMLAVASGVEPGVTWIEGVAEDLPIETATMDRVICQFALMFCTDRARALAELARVTRPGGTVVVATWAELDASPGYAAMVDLLREVAGDEPADALLAPFSVGTESALHELMVETFPGVEVRRWDGNARFPSVLDWLDTDIKAWTLAPLISDDAYDTLRVRAPRDLVQFCDPDGSVRFPTPALVAHAVLAH